MECSQTRPRYTHMQTDLLCSQILTADMTKMGNMDARLNQFSKLDLINPPQCSEWFPWGQVNFILKYWGGNRSCSITCSLPERQSVMEAVRD